jgi:hypothetical protein
MGRCHGNQPDHCCYVAGDRCVYLEENTVPGRHWVCGLRRALGSWDAVHADPGYQQNVQSVWDKIPGQPVESCGAWGPGSNQCCFKEG